MSLTARSSAGINQHKIDISDLHHVAIQKKRPKKKKRRIRFYRCSLKLVTGLYDNTERILKRNPYVHL